MKDTLCWLILSENNKTAPKMAALARDFEKKKEKVDLSGDKAREISEAIEKARGIGAGIITYIDPEYPEELKKLSSPPAYLFYKGDISLLKYPVKVTVVGSRKATAYGLNAANSMAMEIASDNVVVISGGARGVDSAALTGAMRAKGKVICVVGTGIDSVYPPENKRLFDSIVENGGVIITQFPVGMGPLGQNFPIRNSTMTALCDSVLVVEADYNSGSLITASRAVEMGKTLFAVPGNIDSPNSRGTNELIRDGALVALSGADVIFELQERENEKFLQAKEFVFGKKVQEKEKIEIREQEKTDEKGLSPFEKAVLSALREGRETYEEILDFCAMEPKKLTSLLTIMEMKGIIKLAFGNRYKILD